MTLIKMVSQKLLKLLKCSGVILLRWLITILKPAFRWEMQGVTHACQEQEISFLAMEIMKTIRGCHKVERKRVQRIGAHLTRHQGIREQVVVKQVIQFSEVELLI